MCTKKPAASGIILAHNHPSGALRPSHPDIDVTKKLKEGGKLLDIQVLDHIIITSEAYYSFADEGRCSPLITQVWDFQFSDRLRFGPISGDFVIPDETSSGKSCFQCCTSFLLS
jgi:hypothetical protein